MFRHFPAFLSAFLLFCASHSVKAKEASINTDRLIDSEKTWLHSIGVDQNRIDVLAKDPQWLKLLHYRKRFLFSRDQSDADSDSFFLSKEGKYNPGQELLETLLAFNPKSQRRVTWPTEGLRADFGGEEKQHAQCAFPLRYVFLSETTGLSIPQVECPDFQKWIKDYRASAISLVFAAPFFGSPASIFGHTFLRIHTSRLNKEKSQDLLSYAVSFEAYKGSDSSSMMIIKGLTGFYPGMFYQYPYYMKVSNYTDMDSRDLWEYELDFSDKEIYRLLAHLWEVSRANFDYYFFDENCSYHILGLLEAARPDWNLRSQFSVDAIPLDTLKSVLSQKGAVRKTVLRPSLLRTLRDRLTLLTEKERADFFKWKSEQKKPSTSGSFQVAKTDVSNVHLIDTMIDWQKYHAVSAGNRLDTIAQNIPVKLLGMRAKLTSRSLDPQELIGKSNLPVDPPESAHPSRKLGLFFHHSNSESRVIGRMRMAVHDLLDDEKGYLPYSELTIMQIAAGYDVKSKRPILEELIPARVMNLQALDSLRKGFAWKVGGGLLRSDFLKGCETESCLYGEFRGGGGFALEILPYRFLLYTMLNAGVQVTGRFAKSFRVGAGPELGFFLKPLSFWRIFLSVESLQFIPRIDASSHGEQLLKTGHTFQLGKLIEARTQAQWFRGFKKNHFSYSIGLSKHF